LRNLRAWFVGASVWLVVSLVVLLEHLRSTRPDYLLEISWLMSLLWLQFGFAGIFHALRKENGQNALAFLIISFLPPLILFSTAFLLLR
jgi:hypothetical protein